MHIENSCTKYTDLNISMVCLHIVGFHADPVATNLRMFSYRPARLEHAACVSVRSSRTIPTGPSLHVLQVHATLSCPIRPQWRFCCPKARARAVRRRPHFRQKAESVAKMFPHAGHDCGTWKQLGKEPEQ